MNPELSTLLQLTHYTPNDELRGYFAKPSVNFCSVYLSTCFRSYQLRVRNVIEHIAFRIFTLLLIVVDVIVVILDIADVGNAEALELTAVVICSYFMLEIFVRIFAKG